MSQLFSLILSLLLISVSADTIVQDNFGNIIGLPLTGGEATGGYTIVNSQVPTSPYFLRIYINDVTLPGYNGAENEAFYISPSFGDAK